MDEKIMDSGIVVGVDGSRGAALFVIDVSGSMDGEKKVAAKQSAIAAAFGAPLHKG